MAPRDDDKAIDGLLRRSLMRDSAAGDCPAPDILAAYHEGSLEGEEMARHELHFSGCARCREQLAAVSRAGAEVEIPALATTAPARQAPSAIAAADSRDDRVRPRRRIWLLDWRFLTPVAAVLAFAAVVYTYMQFTHPAEKVAGFRDEIAMSKPETVPAPASRHPIEDLHSSESAAQEAPPPARAAGQSAQGAPSFSSGANEHNGSELAKKRSAAPSQLSPEERKQRQALLQRLEQERISNSLEKEPESVARDSAAEADRILARGAAAGASAGSAGAAGNAPTTPATPPAKSNVSPGTTHSAGKGAVGGAFMSGIGSGAGAGTTTAARAKPATPAVPAAGAPSAAPPAAAEITSIDINAPPVAEAQKSDAKLASANQSPAAQSTTATVEVVPENKVAQTPEQSKNEAPLNGRAFQALTRVESREKIIKTPDPAVMYRIADAGFVERTQDSGATWQGQQVDSSAEIIAGSAPAANICWLVGRDGAVYLTKDGITWTKISPPAQLDFVRVGATNASSALVTAVDGRKFSTRNGGRTWTVVQ